MSNELLKEAASVLLTLKEERNALIAKDESKKLAFELTKKMVESGKLSYANSLDKYAELSEKPIDELRVFEKAIELSKSTDVFKLGSVSDFSVVEGNAAEIFKNYLINEE